MAGDVYTHALWKAKPGREQDLIDAWQGLADAFLSLPNPPGRGTLIQSVDDPTVFYSFGPWPSMEAVDAMRADPGSAEARARLLDACETATPAAYRLVLQAG